MCPSQTMMVAAVCLGISDAKGITWALGCAMLLRPHVSMQGHPVCRKCIHFPQHKACRHGLYLPTSTEALHLTISLFLILCLTYTLVVSSVWSRTQRQEHLNIFPISTGSWTSSSLPEAASYLADTCTSHGVQGKDKVKMIAMIIPSIVNTHPKVIAAKKRHFSTNTGPEGWC